MKVVVKASVAHMDGHLFCRLVKIGGLCFYFPQGVECLPKKVFGVGKAFVPFVI